MATIKGIYQRDSFSQTLAAATWQNIYGNAVADTANGRLDMPKVGTTYSGIDTSNGSGAVGTTVIDFTNTEIMAGPITMPATMTANTEVDLDVYSASNSGLHLYVYGNAANNLTFRKANAGVNSDTTITYNSTNHKFWRIRESGGTAFWDTSADGVTWTNQRSLSHGLTMTSCYVGFSCGEGASGGTDGHAYVGKCNIYPYPPETGPQNVLVAKQGVPRAAVR